MHAIKQAEADNPLNHILADNFSGAFDNISDGTRLTDANGIASYLITYSPTGITLSNPTPVPEPLSLTLLTPTLLPLLLRRRPTSRHPHP